MPTSPAPAWAQVKSLFDELLALAPAQRHAALQARAVEPGLRDEVLSLLAFAHAGETEGEFAPVALPHPGNDELSGACPRLEGQRLGAWHVVGVLGHGGMGEVYRARRSDGAYEGEAAIKVLKRGMDSAALLARFAQEQRALARLNHPHIARLFDAGLTPEGQPYFVMELVEGQPIDVAARTCSMDERLQLFLQLADAVAYAHRQLLLHRDLKPSNVLVDRQGQVKLLDFGIAKALEGGAADALTTQLGQRPFTPHYASPEQVRGEPVGTGTDVYSLGVLLYQMLTGARPTGRQATTAEQAARSVLDEAPMRPSRLSAAEATDPQWQSTRKRLAHDLDNVLLKALEKLPERRYASVDAMAADVRAFLAGYPVSARAASPAYLLVRFVARNRWAVLAAGLGALGLLSGLVAAFVQGQAAVAVGALGMGAGLALALAQARSASRARDAAQARFEELRQLAHAVLFDYHTLVEPLAGATPVRQRLVNDAIHYLDRLSKAAPKDRRVLLEMGAAYHTVGLVQRNGFRRPHLGDTAGAMRSYERSIALLGQLVEENPADEAAAYELALALSARGGVLGEDLQPATARRDLAEAATLFTRHLARDTPELRHRLELARTHLRLADVQRFSRHFDAASASVDEARRTLNSLAALQPDHKELPHVWVWVHNIESFMAREQDDWQGVVGAEGNVQALMRELQRREPDNARFIEDIGRSAQWLMATHGRLRDVAQVERWVGEAVALTRRVARADPDDRTARRWYLKTLTTAGWAFVEAGAAQRGVEQLDAARPEIETLLRRFESDFGSRCQQAAFEVAHVLASAAAGPRALAGAAQAQARAQAALDALQRDFSGTTHAAELAGTLATLRGTLEFAAGADCAGTDAWLQRARAPLYALGVR